MFQLSNYKHSIPFAALLIALSSCGHSNPEIHGGNTDPVRVKVMLANPLASASTDTYSGTTEAGSSTTISFLVGGTIKSIHATEGQRVSKGQLNASVDGASLQSAYDIAPATLREVSIERHLTFSRRGFCNRAFSRVSEVI